MISRLTDSNFIDEILYEEKLMLVDFSAKWCMPCKMMKRILEQISNENNNVKIASIDVDESPISSNDFEIQNIPTILFFKNGIVVDEVVGFVPKKEIEELINDNL